MEDHCPSQPVQAGGEIERAPRLGVFWRPSGMEKKIELINAKSGIQQIGSEVWTASEQSADERKFCQKILKSMADHCHRSLWGGGT